MTTVATRIRQIADLDGFDIEVPRDGKLVDIRENGELMAAYDLKKKLKHITTVSDCVKERCKRTYPGFSCRLLNGDDGIAESKTLLRNVGESYEED